MVTGPELSMAATDDRSYLYPHAWSPPLAVLPYSHTAAPWPPEPPLIPLDPAPLPTPWDEASGSAAAVLDDSADYDSADYDSLDYDSGDYDSADYSSERAVIGDALRIPVLWCQFGTCIGRFTHADALGEADVRRKGVAVGWRQDAFGRWACPGCVQRDATFRVVYPLVPARHADQAADRPRAAPSAWDSVEPPRIRLAVAVQREPGKVSRWGHRDAGRHRWQ